MCSRKRAVLFHILKSDVYRPKYESEKKVLRLSAFSKNTIIALFTIRTAESGTYITAEHVYHIQ